MTMNCPSCRLGCDAKARYCPSCGMSLGATMVQQKTLALPSGISGMTQMVDPETIVRRARTTYGEGLAMARPPHAAPLGQGQRELIDLQLDCSGSMNEDFEPGDRKIEAAIRAAVNLVLHKSRIDSNDKISVTSFTDRAQCLLNLCDAGPCKPQIVATLQSLQAGGGTDINAPLKLRLDGFAWERTDVVRRIVLLTDGHGGRPERTAEKLKARGVVLDVIAIGPSPDKVNERLLRAIASPDRYRFINDQRTLVQHYTQLAQKTTTSTR